MPKNPAENLNFSTINLSGFLTNMTRSWSHLAEAEAVGFEVDLEEHVSIRGDTTKLYEILSNLITNAIEILKIYRKKQKNPAYLPGVKVTLRVHPAITGLVQVFVEDNGPGITEGKRHHLFTSGYSEKGGSGIGLWRSKKLAREMGGHLDLVNNYEREELEGHETMPGATAVLELPLYDQSRMHSGVVGSDAPSVDPEAEVKAK